MLSTQDARTHAGRRAHELHHEVRCVLLTQERIVTTHTMSQQPTSKELYHEQQRLMRCALHTLNNLVSSSLSISFSVLLPPLNSNNTTLFICTPCIIVTLCGPSARTSLSIPYSLHYRHQYQFTFTSLMIFFTVSGTSIHKRITR